MGTPPPILMANLGMADSLILMVMALVVFGPRRLPQIGRQLGKLMYEFRKASNDFKFQMEEELRNAEEADRRKKEEEERQRALAAAPPQPQQVEQTTSPSPGSMPPGRSREHPPLPPRSPVCETPIKACIKACNKAESPPPRDRQASTPKHRTPKPPQRLPSS